MLQHQCYHVKFKGTLEAAAKALSTQGPLKLETLSLKPDDIPDYLAEESLNDTLQCEFERKKLFVSNI